MTKAQIGKQIQNGKGAAKTITQQSTDENENADYNTTINNFNMNTTINNFKYSQHQPMTGQEQKPPHNNQTNTE